MSGSEVSSRNLPSRRSSAASLARSIRRRPVRQLAQVAGVAWVVAQRALGALVRGARPARASAEALDPLELGLDPVERPRAPLALARRLLRVVADDEAALQVAFAEADLLHAQVVAHLAVATLAGERRLGGGLAGAHPLAGDPVAAAAAQVAQVLLRGEARSTTQTALPRRRPARSSLTSEITAWSAVLPGQTQTRTGIPVRVTARPTTTWGRSGRWSLEWPKRRSPPSPGSSGPSSSSISKLVEPVSKKSSSTSSLSRSAT